jgi:hypothetical protein
VWAAGIGQVALLTVLLPQERRMRRTGGPGIIGFELAGNPERSQRIMARWGEEGRAAARASLLLDFPYLVTYAVLQSAACNSAGDALRRGGWPPLARWAPLIARAQFAAAAFDATENLSLLGVLGNRSPRLPALARACAQAKFALLLVGWSYAAAGLVSHLSSR